MATWASRPAARARIVAAVPLAVALLSLAASATERADTFNVPGQHRTRTCAPMKSDLVPLRFPDGTPTGFYAHGDDPSQQGGHEPCPPGSMELDAHEVLTAPNGMKLYFHPGGGPDHYRDYVQDGQYGHVAAGDLKSAPGLAPLNLNGKPCPIAASGETYYITPTRIPLDMFYKPNVERGRSGSTYYTYGNPGYDKTGGRGDWTYINWSWVQNGRAEYPKNIVRGGGMVRALGKRDAPFEAGDVAPVIGYSYGPDNQVNGRVTAFYGRTKAGGAGGEPGSDIYGWLPHSYQKTGDVIVPCVRRATTATTRPASPGAGTAAVAATRPTSGDRSERMALNLLSEITAADDAAAAEMVSQWDKRYRGEPDPQARMELLTEMSRLDRIETVRELIDLLAAERQPSAREEAILMLGFMRSTRAEMASFTGRLGADFGRGVERREWLRALDVVSSIPAAESLAFLQELRDRTTPADERLELDETIFKLAPRVRGADAQVRSVIDELKRQARTSENEAIRRRAIYLLARPQFDHRAFFAELLKTERSPQLREYLKKAAGEPRPAE